MLSLSFTIAGRSVTFSTQTRRRSTGTLAIVPTVDGWTLRSPLGCMLEARGFHALSDGHPTPSDLSGFARAVVLGVVLTPVYPVVAVLFAGMVW